jgi:hypothetical protein
MPFALTGDPSQTEISDAINYLLNNFGSNVVIDVNTGIVAGPVGGLGYLYKYLYIKYATSFDGSVGFSNSPTGATYYGSRNNNSSVESTNPADYIWTAVSGGFGTTKFIWYLTSGGRQISIVASASSPGSNYIQDTGGAIDLDIVSGASGVSGYSGFSGTSGLSGYSGLSGFSGTVGANGLNALTAYKVQLQSAANPTFTTPTSGSSVPSGWYSTTSAALAAVGLSVFTPGYVVWYIFGQYNSTTGTINGVAANTTAWTGPTAASIFQDIESDNWNGSTPPTYGSSGTYGTSGYYISRNTGNVYFNNGVFRGDITTDGQGYFSGQTNGTYGIVIGGTLYSVTPSSVGYGSSVPSGSVRAGVYGIASATSGTYNAGIVGLGAQSNGLGVVGSGSLFGGYFSNSISGGNALYSNGPFSTSSNAFVNNFYANFAYILVGQGSGQTLYFQTGPTTGASVATFNATNKPGATNSTNQWIEVIISGSSYQIPVWAS